MPKMVPETAPRLSYGDLMTKLSAAGHSIDQDRDPLLIVGMRGYYENQMGIAGRNDRGIYDDAIFVVTPNFFGSYNGNTDPSRERKGHGTGIHKGMASLNTGLWRAHRFGMHKGLYMALCQTGGKVTVMRDGTPDYPDTGHFGINIHNGSWSGTSSLGCQTIFPAQWESFISAAMDQAKRYFGAKWDKTTIPYALLDA
jgi:lysozyme